MHIIKFTKHRSPVTQRLFHIHFNVACQRAIPRQNKIVRWVTNFCNTASALKIKSRGRPRTIRTPEKIENVHKSVLQSPKLSARKRSAALSISDTSLHRL